MLDFQSIFNLIQTLNLLALNNLVLSLKAIDDVLKGFRSNAYYLQLFFSFLDILMQVNILFHATIISMNTSKFI